MKTKQNERKRFGGLQVSRVRSSQNGGPKAEAFPEEFLVMEPQQVSLSKLGIDRTYQRDLVESRVRNILGDFDPCAFLPILVGRRVDQSLWVVEGQIRTEVARRKGFESMFACVFASEGPEHEAEVFLKINKGRTGVNPLCTFRASVKSPERTWANEVLEVVRSEGLFIPFDVKATGEWPEIKCVGKLELIYKRGGVEMLQRSLKVAVAAWPKERDGLMENPIAGLGELIFHVPSVDDARLISRLSWYPPRRVINETGGTQIQSGGGRAVSVGKVMLKLYNQKPDTKRARWMEDSDARKYWADRRDSGRVADTSS